MLKLYFKTKLEIEMLTERGCKGDTELFVIILSFDINSLLKIHQSVCLSFLPLFCRYAIFQLKCYCLKVIFLIPYIATRMLRHLLMFQICSVSQFSEVPC